MSESMNEDRIEIWLPAKDALPYLKMNKANFHKARKKGRFTVRKTTMRGGSGFEVKLEGIPLHNYLQEKDPEIASSLHVDTELQSAKIESDVRVLTELRPFQTPKVMQWKEILRETESMTRAQLEEYCKVCKIKFPSLKVSVPTIYRQRQKYNEVGVAGLAPRWGYNKGHSSIDDLGEYAKLSFDHYASLFLKEGGPSSYICYRSTIGYLRRLGVEIDENTFPSESSFLRKVKSTWCQGYIDFRRKGKRFYIRNYEFYIERDWTGIAAGQGWVADHHQLDVIVSLPDGTTARPWLSAWRDLRSGKLLSYYLHIEAPKADHVLISFAWAVEKYGLPEFIYLDNGKDYRCIDFTGHESRHKVWDNEESENRARSVIGYLEVEVVFAIAYNAQAKPIERDFKTIIHYFSQLLPGYTSSDPSKRPENLKLEIKNGEILSFDNIKKIFNHFAESVFNKRENFGNLLKGMRPDDAFNKYRWKITTISKEGLMYCYMRSKTCTIGRNGIVDNSLGVTLRYWSAKFYTLRGERVILRRDVREYNKAWVFRESDDAFLCCADLCVSVPGYARTPIEKEELRKQMQIKNADIKQARLATALPERPSADELVANLAASFESANSVPQADVPVTTKITAMDHAVAQHKREMQLGLYNPEELAPEEQNKEDFSTVDLWGIQKVG